MRDAGFASMIVQASKGWSHFSDKIKTDFVYAASIEVDGKRLPALLNIGTDDGAEVSACGSIEQVSPAGNTSLSFGHPMFASQQEYEKHFGKDQGGLGKIIKIRIRELAITNTERADSHAQLAERIVYVFEETNKKVKEEAHSMRGHNNKKK